MLDIGVWELLLIAAVALIVVGPKELPGLVRSVGRWVAKARSLAREFQSGMEAAAEEVDLEEFRKIGSVKSDLENQVRDIGRSAQRMLDDDDDDVAPGRDRGRSEPPRSRPETPRPRAGERVEPEFDQTRAQPERRYDAERRTPPQQGRYGASSQYDDHRDAEPRAGYDGPEYDGAAGYGEDRGRAPSRRPEEGGSLRGGERRRD